MLELLGAEYVIQHIEQECQKDNEELIYRTYITDSLKLSVEHKAIAVRYFDLVTHETQKKVNYGEVVDDICSKLFGGGDKK